jgi:aflatoxin B1 aldehyde reductase
MASTKVQIVFGGFPLAAGSYFDNPETIQELFKVLEQEDVKIIDTAQSYPGSEKYLGQVNAGSRFTIHTKVPGGFIPGSSTQDKILESVHESLAQLKVDNVGALQNDSSLNLR